MAPKRLSSLLIQKQEVIASKRHEQKYYCDRGEGGLTVLRIDEDNLEILVRCILIDPVRIQNTQIGTLPPHSLFCRNPQTLLVLELVDTLIRGLAICSSLSSQRPCSQKKRVDLTLGTGRLRPPRRTRMR